MTSASAPSLNKDPKRVFLSYAHPDEERVRGIYADLQKAGLHPWMDRIDLPPGTEWRQEIDRAIRSSAAFLSLISKASLDRGGILRGEMKLALELRAQRLDGGGLLMPVRLEPCDLPEQLDHIQALDWFEPGGEAKLVQALSFRLEPLSPPRRLRYAAMAAMALLLGVAVSFAIYKFAHRSPSLNPPFANVAPDQPLSLGVTLWRLAATTPDSNSPCSGLKFEQYPLSSPIHVNDRIRFDVRPSRPGYLYILTTELDPGGRRGATLLLFPLASFNNRIAPGGVLLIPPASGGACNMLHITHLGEAEEISLVFSAAEVSDLPPGPQPWPVSRAILSAINESAAVFTSASVSPEQSRLESVTLPDSESRDLGYTLSGPGAVFSFPSAGRGAKRFIARFVLRTSS